MLRAMKTYPVNPGCTLTPKDGTKSLPMFDGSFHVFRQLLLIQPTTNMKGSLYRRDNNSSNDTRRC